MTATTEDPGSSEPRHHQWAPTLVSFVIAVGLVLVGYIVGRMSWKEFLLALALTAVVIAELVILVFLTVRLQPDVADKVMRAPLRHMEAVRAEATVLLHDTAEQLNEALTQMTAQHTTTGDDLRAAVQGAILERAESDGFAALRSPLTSPQLALVERRFGGAEIWIATDHHLIEFDDPSISESVGWNLQHGSTYRYLVRSNVANKSRVGQIREQLKSQGWRDSAVAFSYLTEDQWQRLPHSTGEFILYNATTAPGLGAPLIYIRLTPAEPGPSGALWQIVDENPHEWIGMIQKALEA